MGLTTVPQPSTLPSQSGNSGKYLTTNGADASWGSVGITPTYTDIVPPASQMFTITNVTISSTTMTYTTSAAHNLTTGMRVKVDGVISSDFSNSGSNPNATFTILSATPGSTSFTRTVPSSTMTYTSSGRVYPDFANPSFAKFINNIWLDSKKESI
jgi:hypothetical protein